MTNNKQPFNKRKIIWVGIVLAVALVYEVGHPWVERRFEVDLPSLRENNNGAAVATSEQKSDSSDSRFPDIQVPQPENRPTNGQTRSQKNTPAISSRNSNPFLTPTGKKNRLQSPAGLIYGVGGGGEHRVDHVMRHAVDLKSRPVHSVFAGSKEKILKTIDEAYELVKAKSSRVKSTPDKEKHYRIEHVVDMKRKIGYLGGKRGKRENHPPRSSLTLVLDNGKFVVTAYPDR